MLLKDKVAVIYGAGRIGGAVAREFAGEGATVFVTGREWGPVELVAKEILAAGGYAEPSVIAGAGGFSRPSASTPRRRGHRRPVGTDGTGRPSAAALAHLHRYVDTGRGANWAVVRRPISCGRGVYTIEGSTQSTFVTLNSSHASTGLPAATHHQV